MKYGLKYHKWFGKIGNMRFIISESKLEKTAISWLNKNYGDLEPFESKIYRKYILFIKDGKVIFYYNKDNLVVYFSYDLIWSFFESYFGMDYELIQGLTKAWVEEHYNLDIKKTTFQPHMHFGLLDKD